MPDGDKPEAALSAEQSASPEQPATPLAAERPPAEPPRRPPAEAAADEGELYRWVVQDAPVPICCLSLSWEVTLANRAFCEHFGRTPAELFGSTLPSLHPEADRQTVADSLAALTAGSPPVSHEQRLTTPDGEIRWQRWTYLRLLDGCGQAVAYQAIGEDLTKRKLAQARFQALHELAHKLSLTVGLAETLRGCVEAALEHTAFDAGGAYLVDNRTGALRLVCSAGLSAAFAERISHYPADALQARLVMAGRTLYMHYAELAVPKDDVMRSEGLRSIAIIPVQYQGISIGCLNVASHFLDNVAAADRTMLETLATLVGSFIVRAQEEERREQAEHALRASEEKHRLLAENVTDVIWTMDMSLRFTFISPSIYRLRGYTVAEAMAQPLNEMMSAESLNEVMALLSQKLGLVDSGDATAWEPVVFEAEQPCKDGRIVVTRNSARILPGPDGKAHLIVGVTADITALKQAEAERESLRNQLYEAQKMDAIGRLAGGVAHDFNNVLCAISGNAALALSELHAADPLRELLDEISLAAARAADLTRQLLAFSRKQLIAPKVIDLSSLIEGLHGMLVRLIGEHIVLRTVARQRLAPIRVDPGQIEQVVLNLVVNARDAMPDGGELLIETAEVVLDADYCDRHAGAQPGAYVMLAVSDTGCGMSAEVQEKIFEPFFTTKQLGQGTGLGLATVFGIVTQSGGRIEVCSEPEVGSTFKVYFPRVLAEVEAPDRPKASEPPGGSETVLVVEDEQAVRKLAVKMLRRCGYQVLSAVDGRAALALAERHEGAIDLLLTDVVMPHLDGRELASRITALYPKIKVLYTSGYTHSIIARHGVLDEGMQLLAKPYTFDTLTARVRRILDSD